MAKLWPSRCQHYQVSGGSNKANGDHLVPSLEQMSERESAKRNLCLEAEAIKFKIIISYFDGIFSLVDISDKG